MEAPFKVGQKVVCINDNWTGESSLPKTAPKKDDIVIVESCHLCRCGLCNQWMITIVGDYTNTDWVSYCFAPLPEQRERINYVAVSETLREKSIETVITQTN